MNPEDFEGLFRTINNIQPALDSVVEAQKAAGRMQLEAALAAQRTFEDLKPVLRDAVETQKAVEKMQLEAAVNVQRSFENMKPALSAMVEGQRAAGRMQLEAALAAQGTFEDLKPVLRDAVEAQKMAGEIQSALDTALSPEAITKDLQPALNAVRKTLRTANLNYIEFLDIVELESIRESGEYEYHKHWGYDDWIACAYVYADERFDEKTPDSVRELFIETVNLLWFIYKLHEMGDIAADFFE
jgi:hypothetical protein